MKSILYALSFGWPFLRPYKNRLFLGLGLGGLFGVSGALFVWVTKILFERLTPAGPQGGPAAAPAIPFETVQSLWQHISEWGRVFSDTWLPRYGEGLDTKQIIGVMLILPALALLRGGLGYASSYFMKWVSERMLNDMRFSMIQKINSLSLDYFVKSRTGDLTKRINSDTDAVYYFVNLGLTDLIREPVTLIGILVSLAMMDWQLLLAAILVFPVSVAPIQILGRKVRNASKAKNKTQIRFSSLLLEIITNVRMIKAFSLQSMMEARFFRFRREIIGYNMRMAKATELINPLIEVGAAVGIGIILVYVFKTERSIGDLVAFLTGFGFAANPIKKLSKVHLYTQNARVSIERIMETVREMPTVVPPPNPKHLPSFQHSLKFEKVSFTYGATHVLQDINVEVTRGMKLGIAGESGSGKSTLINLVFRFYDPTEGKVLIDGLDLREIDEADLRRQMALVSQEVLLFDDTVAANIALGHPGAKPDEIEKAARAAHAHDFIMAMPQGYDTRIGERGVTLSGGQRQRLSIARAFVRNAPILVLDEATAALDSQSEEEVQKAIDELSQNRTVITVAHRLSTLRTCDRIMVLDKGRILEFGGFDDLLRKGGAFASMAARQGMFAGPNPTP